MLPLVGQYLSVGVAGPAIATPISQYLVRFPTICTLVLPLYQGTAQLYSAAKIRFTICPAAAEDVFLQMSKYCR